MSESNQISVINKDINDVILRFEKLKEVATYLSTSETFTKGFEIKDAAGVIVMDEATGRPMINIADIAICLMAGNEVGLDMTGSLLLGKKLNQATYLSILKGRSIGVDVATSIEKIVSIPTQNGLVSYTMVDVISAKLLQGGVSFLPFIKNYAPFYQYFHAVTKEEQDLDVVLDENDNLKDNCFIVDATVTPDSLTAAKNANKLLLTKVRNGYYSKVKMTRTYPDGRVVTMYQRFSTVDAQRAGLLPIYNEKGELVSPGKRNWETNTPQMMNNRCISIPGRIIGADLINGLYLKEELVDSGIIKDNGTVDTNAEVIN